MKILVLARFSGIMASKSVAKIKVFGPFPGLEAYPQVLLVDCPGMEQKYANQIKQVISEVNACIHLTARAPTHDDFKFLFKYLQFEQAESEPKFPIFVFAWWNLTQVPSK